MRDLSKFLGITWLVLFSQLVVAEAPSEVELINKLEAHASRESFEAAKAYLKTLEREEFQAGYDQLADIFKNEISKEKYTDTVKQLHSIYGKPKTSKVMGALSGKIRNRDGEEFPTQAILFNSTLIKTNGLEEGALIKITVLADKKGNPLGVIQFTYTPKSNIQYKGSYKLPKDNDS